MFSCCTGTTRGSGLKKDNREGHRGVWRHRIHSCLRRLWPFSRKGNILPNGNQDQDCTDQGENPSAPQDLREPQRKPHITAEAAVKLGENPSAPQDLREPQRKPHISAEAAVKLGENPSAPQDLREPQRKPHISAEAVVKLRENASAPQDLREPSRKPYRSAEAVIKLASRPVPSLEEENPFFSPAFLSEYRSFVTPLHVKTLELMSYAFFFGPYEEDAQVMNTLCGFLHAWMDKNPEDFCGPTDLFPVRYMEAYWSAFMPHSGLIVNNNMLPTPAEGRTD
uniref:uncharacterized protein LOC117702259 n=1 Tax=Arvicanthis niloticus TaxID=61156 RepID=UPI001485E370|nr:uncharacterized protein LOC117702259 [Arvicanthis niloticus]